MSRRELLLACLVGLAGNLTSVALAQPAYSEARQAGTAQDAMGFANPYGHAGYAGYGARRLGGMYEDQWQQDLYSRKIEHGAYSSSNGRYGFALGIGLQAGFADAAAYPVGEGNPAAFNSPWYQMPYYWNSSSAPQVNTYMPNPGTFPWYGYRPPFWNGGGGWGPMPMPFPVYGGQPMYGGAPMYGGYGGGAAMYGGGAPMYGGGGQMYGAPAGGGMYPSGPTPLQAGPTFW